MAQQKAEQVKEIFGVEVKQQEAPKQEHLPATMNPTDGQFIDGADELVRPPVLKLVQSMSEEAKQGTAKPGQFFFSGDSKVIDGPLTVVPLMMARQWVEFDQDFKLVFSTNSKLEAINRWGDDSYKYDSFPTVVFIRELEQAAVIRFRSTSKRVAIKMLNTGGKKLHMSAFVYELKSEEQTKGTKIKYHTIVCRHLGASKPEEQEMAAYFAKNFSGIFKQGGDDAPEADIKDEAI